MAFKLNIHDVLAAIDRKDYAFYERLTDEEKKGFAGVLALRWASIVENPHYAKEALLLSNYAANIRFHDLYEHPELQFKLLAASGMGVKVRHGWIPIAGSQKKRSKLRSYIEERWPDANGREIAIIEGQLTGDALIEFLKRDGLDDKQIKDLIDGGGKKVSQKPKAKGGKSGKR